MAWSLVTALLLLAFGHSGLGVSLRPCCAAVGHCLAPFGPVRRCVIRSGESSATLVPITFSSSFSGHAAL